MRSRFSASIGNFSGGGPNLAPKSGPPPCPPMAVTHRAHPCHAGRTSSPGRVPALASNCTRRNLCGVLALQPCGRPKNARLRNNLYIRFDGRRSRRRAFRVRSRAWRRGVCAYCEARRGGACVLCGVVSCLAAVARPSLMKARSGRA